MNQLTISIYLYADNMTIESTRLECCGHVIKVAPYFQVELRQVPFSRINSLRTLMIVIDRDILS